MNDNQDFAVLCVCERESERGVRLRLIIVILVVTLYHLYKVKRK